jgi:hypothetical protein
MAQIQWQRVNIMEDKGHGVILFEESAGPAVALILGYEQYLQKAADDGFPYYPLFERDRSLASLRQNPRFIEFLANQNNQWEYFKANLD